ncbi:MAG: hypothetical protein IJ278_04520 [Clostridia bacterium]|nr:hypothetical protein [Clostridia bacterium]
MKRDMFPRFTLILVLTVLFMLAVIFRLFSLQIVKGEDYAQASMKRLVKTVPLKAQRGEILDRYGRVIVSSQITYNLEISQYKKDKKWVNDTVYSLILLMEKEDQEYMENLPVTEAPYSYTLSEEDTKKYLKKMELDTSLSAEECIKELKERYQISDEIPQNYLRKVIAVRAEMEQREFSPNNTFVFA